MRKFFLTAVAVIALSSPVFAQSEADMKKATDSFLTGMDNMSAALEKQRDTVCPNQNSDTDKFICKIQFASAVATVAGIKFDQIKVEMNANLANKTRAAFLFFRELAIDCYQQYRTFSLS